MRPGRVVVLASLPVLAVLGAVRSVPALPPTPVAVLADGLPAPELIVTDGRPQPIALPVRRHAPAGSGGSVVEHLVTRHVVLPRPSAAPPPQAVRVAVPAAVDGYPYARDTTGGVDPWGFTMRQCVSYVAWQLAQAGRPLDNASQGWGSALDWDDAARRLGHAVTSTARVGAVAQWNAGERGAWWSTPSAASADGTFAAGSLGHVAWVTKVYGDGSVLVAQYNGDGHRSFSTMRVRAPRYLLV